MKQENHCKWGNTPISELPTSKLKNILRNHFTYTTDQTKNKFISLNNINDFYGTKGFELKKMINEELFKRRLYYNLQKKLKQNEETNRQINKLLGKIFNN